MRDAVLDHYLIKARDYCVEKRRAAQERLELIQELLKEYPPYTEEELEAHIVYEINDMKLIRTSNHVLAFTGGMLLQQVADLVAAISNRDIVLYKGDRSLEVFEALIQFLAGREVLFDVDKFVEKLNRVEGSSKL